MLLSNSATVHYFLWRMKISECICSVILHTFVGCLLVTTATVTSINASNHSKFVLQLIHRDSIFPAVSLLSKCNGAIAAPLTPTTYRSLFWVNISIGSPPLPELIAMDTGSSLTWVGRGKPDAHPVYDPKASSTNKILACGSTRDCFGYYTSYCGRAHCIYEMTYGDNTRSTGVLASEKFTFMTTKGGTFSMSDFIFGIETDDHGTAPWLYGILGLQGQKRHFKISEHSLVSRVGFKFSYCIGNISDPSYPFNQLILGDGAIFEGDSTPMSINNNGRYVVTLEGISVGDTQLDIDEEEFKYNVVIDSGSTFCSLPRIEYEQLKKEVMRLIGDILYPVKHGNDPDRLCYWGNLERDLKGFPTVTLHFSQDADLNLDVERMFQRLNDNVFCMAFRVSTADFHIIGIHAQQYYNIGFDVNVGIVTFLDIECELLQDN